MSSVHNKIDWFLRLVVVACCKELTGRILLPKQWSTSKEAKQFISATITIHDESNSIFTEIHQEKPSAAERQQKAIEIVINHHILQVDYMSLHEKVENIPKRTAEYIFTRFCSACETLVNNWEAIEPKRSNISSVTLPVTNLSKATEIYNFEVKATHKDMQIWAD
ncbi:hypothetical protein B9Z55_026535 [Caenorhabditis nigoni]|uniref:Uncharacterized protein n=1 Tax=Caenorhabditis nigoni TaxID=1611254 RepID=A0A2G5T369_9PELO|nr:hypothetical protein B9Z55_026535 [Caenorhabditis nigoni]